MAYVSTIISLLALLVAIWNVNRQKVANKKNEDDKFRRDITRLSYDELIELLHDFGQYSRKYRSLDSVFKQCYEYAENNTKEKPFYEFNEYLWELIHKEMELINRLSSLYEKREIVLVQYQEEINRLKHLSEDVTQPIWIFKQKNIELLYDHNVQAGDKQDCLFELEGMKSTSEIMIRFIKDFQKRIQNDFYGVYFNRVLK